ARVEHELEAVLNQGPPLLAEPALRMASSGGKRLRPAFVVMASLCGSGALRKQAVTTAAAVELVHLASLIHDDIMDEADTRRGNATIHAQEGRNQAILVGDYVFSLACR